MKINVIIIGSGKMASAYSEVLQKNKKFNLLGAYSRNKEILKSFCSERKIVPFKDFKEIINFKSLDLLIIAVTATNLRDVINKIYKIKCKVLIEKPFGINYAEAKYLHQKILYKKNFFIALNRRYYGSVLLAKKKLKKVKKKLIYIEDHIDFGKLIQLGFNNRNKKYFVYSHSIHLIDFLNIFSNGKILNIYKKKIIVNKNINIFAVISYSTGDIGIYNCSYDSKEKWKISIKSEHQELIFQPIEELSLSNQKVNNKNYSFHLDKKYKPGIWNLLNDALNLFQNKPHNLLRISYGLKLMKLINSIHEEKK